MISIINLILLFVAGLLIGAFLGILIMCMLIVANSDED